MPDSSASASSNWAFSTLCATVSDPDHPDQYGASSVPIYQSTTFKGLPGSSAKASEEFDYSRSGNPTRTVLQQHLSKIQGCKHSFAVATGMACLDIITRSVRPGECIIAGDDIYGGTNRLLGLLSSHGGILTHHIDTTDAGVLEQTVRQVITEHEENIGPRLAMVILETPTNPLLKIVDIKGCVAAVRSHADPVAVPIVMDNTMMSPALMRPLDLGVDTVYDSATKYLSGHHDLMAGAIATNRDDLAKFYAFTINSVGNALAPFESFLLLRGLKTLSLRLNAQQHSAQVIAEHLDGLGFRTHYPGLASHPGRAAHFAQAKGAGAVMSFETEDPQLSQRIVGATKLWGVSVSFGCVNSLISMPCLMSHASIDPKVRAARRLPEDLIRLCIGIEDVEDLIADLDSALLAAGAIQYGPGGKLTRNTEQNQPSINGSSGVQDSSVLASAPGKVILFGEHAVVHGVTALAGSVNLRCYCLASNRADGRLQLELPDLKVSHTWPLVALPWDALHGHQPGKAPVDLDAKLLRRVVHVVEMHDGGIPSGDRSHASCVSFLYLYMLVVGPPTAPSGGQSFTFRALLPMGAGLGSSASYSASLSAALLSTHGFMSLADDPTADVPRSQADLINKFAFLAEKIIHGNPSGVDNSVAVYGGCLAFTRPNATRNSFEVNSLKLLQGVHAKRFLLTDTGVPRNTKALVAGVQEKLDADPGHVGDILTEIQSIVDRAEAILSSSSDDDDELGSLVLRNHTLLAELGVSHESLELVRSTLSTTVSPALEYTKLTGAGGGGCAVTLVPSTYGSDLTAAKETLEKLGMRTFEVTIGGPGVSIQQLSSQTYSSAQGRAVQGETGEVVSRSAAYGGSWERKFKECSAEELAAWLEGERKGGATEVLGGEN